MTASRSKRVFVGVVAAATSFALLPAAATASGGAVDVIDFEDAEPCADAPLNDFVDVAAGSSAADFIDCIAAFGITVGTGDGSTYSPGATVQRQTMALFIARFLVQSSPFFDEIPQFETNAFDDIADLNDAQRHAINFLAEQNVVQGSGDGNFNPYRLVDRQQMATFVGNTHLIIRGFADDSYPTDVFADIDAASSVHQPRINFLAWVGVVGGVDAAPNYAPNDLVTRRQMAAFLGRSIGALDSIDLWEGEFVAPDEPDTVTPVQLVPGDIELPSTG